MNVLSRFMMSAWRLKIAAVCAIAALVLTLADSNSIAQPPDGDATRTVQGTVRSLTRAPMGEIDGAILDSGTVIHWPPHLADRFSGVAVRGDRIRVTGWMETGPEGDTQLEVRTITNVRTNASIANDGPALAAAAWPRPAARDCSTAATGSPGRQSKTRRGQPIDSGNCPAIDESADGRNRRGHP